MYASLYVLSKSLIKLSSHSFSCHKPRAHAYYGVAQFAVLWIRFENKKNSQIIYICFCETLTYTKADKDTNLDHHYHL